MIRCNIIIDPDLLDITILSSQVYEELVQAIKDAEEGLFHLKRARLLREADSVLHCSNHTSEAVKVEPLDPADVEPELLEEQSYLVGSRCRFRHTDGRWYNGQIVELDGSDSAKISFLTPTSENMLLKWNLLSCKSNVEGEVIGSRPTRGVGLVYALEQDDD
uniref:Tudor domain-containing protein n=1 Tax=Fagus sylvatica TaxID=28930 RepID=A0A2N9F3G8_FAGSY